MNMHDYWDAVVLMVFGFGVLGIAAFVAHGLHKETETRNKQDESWDSLYEKLKKGDE